MAKAVKAKVEATVMQDGIRLDLSNLEAAVLQRIFRKIGGNPDKSARGDADRISQALYDAGVQVSDDEFDISCDSGLYFKDRH